MKNQVATYQDHMLWRYDNARWLKDVRNWDSDIEDLKKQIAQLSKVVNNHLEDYHSHCEEIIQQSNHLDELESCGTEGTMDNKSLVEQDEAEGSKHKELREIHERIKKDHYQLTILMLSLTGSLKSG
jgi:hypothetical protein